MTTSAVPLGVGVDWFSEEYTENASMCNCFTAMSKTNLFEGWIKIQMMWIHVATTNSWNEADASIVEVRGLNQREFRASNRSAFISIQFVTISELKFTVVLFAVQTFWMHLMPGSHSKCFQHFSIGCQMKPIVVNIVRNLLWKPHQGFFWNFLCLVPILCVFIAEHANAYSCYFIIFVHWNPSSNDICNSRGSRWFSYQCHFTVLRCYQQITHNKVLLTAFSIMCFSTEIPLTFISMACLYWNFPDVTMQAARKFHQVKFFTFLEIFWSCYLTRFVSQSIAVCRSSSGMSSEACS